MSIDYKYLNVVIYNRTAQDQLCQYSDTRSQAVIEKANDFEMSVVRFSVPTQRMPIFIFPEVPVQIPPIDKYVIGYQNGLNGIPTTQGLTVANFRTSSYSLNNFPVGDIRQNYVYSTLDWVDFINFTVSSLAAIGPDVPYLLYDPSTAKLEWLLPGTFVSRDDQGGVAAQYLYMNSALYNTFFSGFSAIYNQATNSYLINGRNRPNNNITPGTYAGIGYETYAQYDENNSLVSWNTIRRLVILSSQLQVNNESVSILNNNQPVNASILSDYEIPFSQTQPINKAYSFYQPAVFRFASLITDTPIQKIDLFVFFENSTDQQLYPLYIAPLQDCYVKIMFRRRIMNPNVGISLIEEHDRIDGKGKEKKQQRYTNFKS